jgi:hypothetical protein
MRFRQFAWSLAGFAIVVIALISVDENVRHRFETMLWGGDGVGSWDTKAMGLGNAMVSLFRYQSLENGPLLIFAAVGVLLFFFMVRT